MGFSKETIRLKFRNDVFLPLTRKFRRKYIINPNFTIISNNCWGGTIYESYGLKKQSPTVGMFIMPEDYIKFVKRLKYYVSVNPVVISTDESKWKYALGHKDNWGTYIIIKLDDIELHMLHYHDSELAKNRWQERKTRIVWDRILYKFNDQNGATRENIREFLNLDVRNKVCFVSKEEFKDEDGVVYINQNASTRDGIKASYEPFGNNRHININNLVNNL